MSAVWVEFCRAVIPALMTNEIIHGAAHPSICVESSGVTAPSGGNAGVNGGFVARLSIEMNTLFIPFSLAEIRGV